MPTPTTQEPTVLRTVSDLLAAVDRLPPAEREAARGRIDAALRGDARSCRAALGVLALDLAAPPAPPVPPRELEVRVHVIDLEHDPLPTAASA
jgi:hypothetical protein